VDASPICPRLFKQAKQFQIADAWAPRWTPSHYASHHNRTVFAAAGSRSNSRRQVTNIAIVQRNNYAAFPAAFCCAGRRERAIEIPLKKTQSNNFRYLQLPLCTEADLSILHHCCSKPAASIPRQNEKGRPALAAAPFRKTS
jgi:hypothetical protein